nr:unnamed protein product [Haemonchus contortus]
MGLPQLNHKYAIVKLYPGLDETIFGKLLNGLGLEVVFTNDLADGYQAEKQIISSCTEGSSKIFSNLVKFEKPVDALEDPLTPQSPADERAVREWMALIEFIETNVNVDLDAKSLEPSSNDASVQTSESETASSKMEDGASKVITCMLCQEEVPRDKKSIKLHVQTHSGKRYGCSRCKYHTDRKFDQQPSESHFPDLPSAHDVAPTVC